MLRIVKTFKPGIYIRRQVYYKNKWVTFQGFVFLPICKPPRKWAGLAWVTLASEPTPAPKVLRRHDSNGHEYLTYYNPAGGSDNERIKKLVTRQSQLV